MMGTTSLQGSIQTDNNETPLSVLSFESYSVVIHTADVLQLSQQQTSSRGIIIKRERTDETTLNPCMCVLCSGSYFSCRTSLRLLTTTTSNVLLVDRIAVVSTFFTMNALTRAEF